MPIKQRRVIRTTLGELVVAVTDEVMPFVREPTALYPTVSGIISDVLARHHLRVPKRSQRKYPGRLARRQRDCAGHGA
jgi:hypothetical protein